ncbi:MAG TPA: outer membrane beta-barrel protein, partial [Terriglobales bacterium]
MANYDYARGDLMKGIRDPAYWSGIAGYVRYALNSKYTVATRYEYYDDHNGFTTGNAAHIQEFTGTLQRTIASHILTNLEFRRDFSNQPVFTKGAATPVTAQTTATAGLVFTFDSREPN